MSEGLTVSHLKYAYSKKSPEVLHDITFSAHYGDVLSILGPNGVGKSTMFKCILGFFKEYSGTISLDGEDIRALTHKQIAKKIAYIPQSTYPTFNYDVLDVVLMGMTAHLSALSSPNEHHIKEAHTALESLGIGHLENVGYGEISGGERQLVLITRALVQKAKLLIMDEPTANLDYGNQLRIMCRVAELAREGYLIILSTHNPDHAFLYANRVLVLQNGGVIAEGNPDAVLTEEVIRQVYGVDTRISTFEDERGIHKICYPLNGGVL